MGPMTDTPGSPDKTDESVRPGARPGAVVVVGPDGRPVGTVNTGAAADDDSADPDDPSRLIEQPAKVMRIGSMIKQLLEEVRAAPLDEASRQRLREIHQRSITELEDGLAPELREELERISLPFEDGATPSESELRVAQAQLVGWLEGLFHGIQAALMAQQMAARLQLEQMRTGGRPALPAAAGGMIPGMPGQPGQPGEGGGRTGQYL
ncbi:bacterial proteasome activator family protein [Solwaraspora sp. WMMD406]|uniref:bacterial proteasome activator family protein n=1 Tax=Solwaraspora sp. WMMD406 TaxID=3016095 RepID=UPI00241778ED|nr:bacterial proteasome activator family protein [Solwaraspora sp. WMMD406]MDG4763119.1 bacterial proteasome activator family protein [Solwaraspora sp. WMMD406]